MERARRGLVDPCQPLPETAGRWSEREGEREREREKENTKHPRPREQFGGEEGGPKVNNKILMRKRKRMGASPLQKKGE